VTENAPVPAEWSFTDADETLAQQLRPRLPDRLFDVHLHLYRASDVRPPGGFLEGGPEEAGYGVWREHLGKQVGVERLVGGLLTPFPSRDGDLEAANDYVAAELERAPSCPGSIIVAPGQSRDEVEARLEDSRLRCLKPYHFLGSRARSWAATLEEYLPEWAWELAHERGLAILLHMVRTAALADPENQKSIRRCCETYPGARLILAHAARGFHAPNTVRAISALHGLENVCFDTAAVCEADALAAILGEYGPRRLMWGSDFPVCQQRGRCVTLGTGFAWVTTDLLPWNEKAFHGEPVLVGLESLRAVLDAADRVGLDAEDLEDLFCDNALRLFGLKSEPNGLTQSLYSEAKRVIPGGVQLLSKRPEMAAPDQWPAHFRRARGCEVWDMDGRHYYDVGRHGIGACLLGFRDPDVTRAVRRRLALGSYSTQSPPEEVELARLLCELHPWAEQVRYARTGGEIMSVAVRIARATTDRSLVAVCGYHGWHDWYLAANLGEHDALRGHLLPGLEPLGVPRELRGTNLPFTYNNRQELREIIERHGDRLAAVVMEPCRHHAPEPGFLEFVRDQAHGVGALLVFDEISIGWRLELGGAHLRFGVAPDMAVFAKAMGNGHPMAAVIGTRKAMDGANTSFISSTYWTEGVGPAAALATISKMRRIDVPAHCERIGTGLQETWRASARRHGLPLVVADCFPAFAYCSFEHELARELDTLYVQLMLERGFLGRLGIQVSLAHTDGIMEEYAAAIDEVFAEIADALAKGEVEKRLKGPVAHSGFRRLLD